MNKQSQALSEAGMNLTRSVDDIDATGAPIDFRGLVNVLLRRRFMIVAVAFLCLCAAAAIALMSPTRYAASANVMLNTRTLNIAGFDSVLSGLGMNRDSLETEMTFVRSEVILNRVIDELGLLDDPEFNVTLQEPSAFSVAMWRARAAVMSLVPEPIMSLLSSPPQEVSAEDAAAARRALVLYTLREAISIDQVALSLSFSVTALSERPAMAARIANTIARTYVDEQLRSKINASERATQWLSERVAAQRQSLSELETRLADLNASAAPPTPTALDAKTEQLRTLRERLAATRAERERVEGDITAVRSLVEARDFAEAARRLSEASPGLRTALADNAGPEILAPLISSAEREREAIAVRLAQTIETLTQGIARLEEEMSAGVSAQAQLQQLTRDVDVARLVYESLLSQLTETNNQSGSFQADARIVSTATPPSSPVEPKRALITIAGGAFGLILGCGLAFLLEAFNNRIRSASEAERKLGYEVLTSVPLLNRRRRLQGILARLAEAPTAVEAGQYFRSALALRHAGSSRHVVMVTSSRSGEGKSTACLLLAQAEAASGRSVVIVEADLRRPAIAKVLPSNPGKGDLVSAIEGRTPLSDSIHFDKDSGISFIPVRQPMSKPARIISSPRFAEMILALRAHYDMVILDTPPVMLVSDALTIGRSCDAAVYAIRWNSTPIDTAAIGIGKLDQHGIPMVGTVLTMVDLRKASRYAEVEYGYFANENPYIRT